MMTKRYRRQPGAVSAVKIQPGISLSDLCSTFPIHRIEIDYWYEEVPAEKEGVLHCSQGELRFHLGDYIVKDQYGNLAVYRPEEFKQEFEAVNADGEE